MTSDNKPLAPGSYADFLHYLDTVTTEKALFSRLTYWFAFRTSPDDVRDRIDLVQERAKELRLWNGLELKVERWTQASREEFRTMGKEAFSAAIAADYAAYRDGDAPAEQMPRLRCLSDIRAEETQWLVPGLLPLGEISLLGADGGTGKGIWQAQLIAYVTTGKTSPFFPEPPAQTGRVLILAGEDDPGKVLKGRIEAAGADMSRVMVVTADDYFNQTGRSLCVTDKALADFAASCAPTLLILDPLQSFLPATVEMASRNQMRSALLPLKGLCTRHGMAVLIAMHTNKKQNVSGRARLADSSDIWDIARSVLMMGRDRNTGQTYLSHEKSSYSKPAQTVLLHIADVAVNGLKTAKAVFDGYSTKKDADFIGEHRFKLSQTKDDTAAAILNVLAESRLGSMPSNELRTAVTNEIGCSIGTYNRAYSELVRSGSISKKPIRQRDGKARWYSYCGGANDKVQE